MRNKRLATGAILLIAIIGCGKEKVETGGPGDKNASQNHQDATSIKVWKDFTPPSRSFRAKFPWGNAIHWPFTGFDKPLPTEIAEAMKYRSSRDEMDGDRYYTTDYFNITEAKFTPGSSAAECEKALDQLLRDEADQWGIKLSEPKSITWSGQPAKEMEGIETPKEKTNRMQARRVYRVLVTAKFGYIGIVRDTGNPKKDVFGVPLKLTPGDVKMFLDSFTLTK